MPIYRGSHENNFVVVDKGYLRDKDLSLKAKRLLTLMLSLPDDWKYSLSGLKAICRESAGAISSALKELKARGYVKVSKYNASSDEKGRFGYAYEIFEHTGSPSPDDPATENPAMENPAVENPGTENPGTENMGLIRIINNQELNNQEKNNKAHSHQERAGAGGGVCFSENDDWEDGTEDADAKGNTEHFAAMSSASFCGFGKKGVCRSGTAPRANRHALSDSTAFNAGAQALSGGTASTADAPDIRVSAHPLSGCAGRPTTNDRRPMTASRRPTTAAVADAQDIRGSAHPLSGCAGRPMTNDLRPMTSVPQPTTASAADAPDTRGSAHPLSGCAGRPMTNDQRPMTAAPRPMTNDLRPTTAASVSYALRQGIGMSENNLKELNEFADKLGDEAVVWAVDEALASGKKFYAYVRGILNKRIALGAKNITDIRSMEERRYAGSDKYLGCGRPGNAPGRFDCDITV
ncbi:MAG: hypothetical protein K5784_12015 [Clostridiales bacterium]|nr:hypothetical protein [Clostridiales bacterium]